MGSVADRVFADHTVVVEDQRWFQGVLDRVERETRIELTDLLEAAWGLIANAGEGERTTQTQEWQDAAVRWRERYHAVLKDDLVEAPRSS